MLNSHLLTYCENCDALQAWLAANYNDVRDLVFQSHNGYSVGKAKYVFIGFDKFKTIKSDDEISSLTFVIVRNQRQLDVLNNSPIEILAAGDCNDPDNCPYQKVVDDPIKLAKFRSVLSEEKQLEKFGSEFRFCVVGE